MSFSFYSFSGKVNLSPEEHARSLQAYTLEVFWLGFFYFVSLSLK